MSIAKHKKKTETQPLTHDDNVRMTDKHRPQEQERRSQEQTPTDTRSAQDNHRTLGQSPLPEHERGAGGGLGEERGSKKLIDLGSASETVRTKK